MQQLHGRARDLDEEGDCVAVGDVYTVAAPGPQPDDDEEEEAVRPVRKRARRSREPGPSAGNGERNKASGTAVASVAGREYGVYSTAEYLSLQEQLYDMETERRKARMDLVVMVRKADRRFQEEWRTRKAWNVEKTEFRDKISMLQQQAQLAERTADLEVAARTAMKQQLSRVRTLLAAEGGGVGNSDAVAAMLAELAPVTNSTLPVVPVSRASPGGVSNYIKAPFCVICQSHTADTMLLSCGHICMCHDHALQMDLTGNLRVCPLCKAVVTGTCRAKGLVD